MTPCVYRVIQTVGVPYPPSEHINVVVAHLLAHGGSRERRSGTDIGVLFWEAQDGSCAHCGIRGGDAKAAISNAETSRVVRAAGYVPPPEALRQSTTSWDLVDEIFMPAPSGERGIQ